MMLPSKDRRQFAGKVHEIKKKHLKNMVMDGKLPLRPGQLLKQATNSVGARAAQGTKRSLKTCTKVPLFKHTAIAEHSAG